MADEQDVNAGSETSGEEAAETSQEEAAAETTDASAEQSEETSTDAGGAAETEVNGSETSGEEVPDANASRTGFADAGLKAGDACKCPDGRKGTVHRYDAGLICIPNADQG